MSEKTEIKTNILIIGIDKGVKNAINHMIALRLEDVSFATINTDGEQIQFTFNTSQIQMSSNRFKHLGTGGNPLLVPDEVLTDYKTIVNIIHDFTMVFIVAGIEGEHSTKMAPIIAQVVKSTKVLSVGLVAYPFDFEGIKRCERGEDLLERMNPYVDTLITIPNQHIYSSSTDSLSLSDASEKTNQALCQAVNAILSVRTSPPALRVDFDDIRTIMQNKGFALFGLGYATGEGSVVKAAKEAIISPLLGETTLSRAKSVLINVTSSHDVTFFAILAGVQIIEDKVHKDAHVIFGWVANGDMEGTTVSIIATELEEN